ncbi:DNA topoisomerase [Azospirillum sp. B4]|uniref:DNA topoisomerase n=1 Tax=Azospirillum sp. B4 TaxID=95605 RepID=UPI00034B585C|nr:DNA topoisomerase [Azospirillum sp. B4]
MRTVVLFEKGTAAAIGAAALGPASRKIDPDKQADVKWLESAGQIECKNNTVVVVARGHLLEPMEPDEFDAKWAGSWKFSQLPIAPAELRYRPSRDERGSDAFARGRLRLIGELLKGADRLVIATDMDRAGEAIAYNIIDHLKWRGRTQRLRMKDTTVDGFPAFWKEMESDPNSAARYEPLAWEERARTHEDYVNGMTASRGASLKLKPPELGFRESYNSGNVMSPVVGLLAKLEDRIRAFKPRDFFVIQADVDTERRHQVMLSYEPREEESRLWYREEAEAIAAAAKGHKGALQVETKPVNEGPPRPYNTAAIHKAAGAVFKFSPDKTQKIIEGLYLEGFITYPRTPGVFYPEARIGQVPTIARNLGQVFPALSNVAGTVAHQAVVRRGSRYNDAKAAAHQGIMPTTKKPVGLTEDQVKVYQLIARNWLSQHLPDAVDLRTSIKLPIPFPASVKREGSLVLSATGSVEQDPGWRIADAGHGSKSRDKRLPPVKDGEGALVTDAFVEQRRTEPPKRIKLVDLTSVMAKLIDHLDQFVSDPAELKRLKNALKTDDPDNPKGLGSPSTYAPISKKVRDEGFVREEKGFVVPTAKGFIKVASWEGCYPTQVDPVTRAETEFELSHIGNSRSPAEARQRYQQYCEAANRRAAAMTQALESAGPVVPDHVSVERAVSPKMAKFAKDMAARSGVKLDKATLGSFDKLKSFVDTHKETDEERQVRTPKQTDAITKLAPLVGYKLPEGWEKTMSRQDAIKALDAMGKLMKEGVRVDGTPIPPTQGQVSAITNMTGLAAKRGITAPDPKSMTFKTASEFWTR